MKLVSYILVQLAPGSSQTAAEAISKIEGVKMAHAVTGPFDVIAFAEVPDLVNCQSSFLRRFRMWGGRPEDSDGRGGYAGCPQTQFYTSSKTFVLTIRVLVPIGFYGVRLGL